MPVPNTAERPCATYERLRETALGLFCARGYHATSLRDLARELGVQAGSLYHHIESKQALLFDIMEEALECLLAEIRREVKDLQAPELRLRRFVQACVNVQASHARSLLLLEREACHLSAAQHARIEQLRQRYQGCLQGILASLAPGLKACPVHLHMLTHAVLGMLHNTLPLLPLGAATGDRVEQLLAMVHRAAQTPAGLR
jgi:Transcriptional regulator